MPSTEAGGHTEGFKWFEDRPTGTLKAEIFKFFDEPLSSKWAFIFSIINMCVIVISVVTFVLDIFENRSTGLFYVELAVITFFTVDYIVRISTAHVWYRWAITPLAVVDLLSILPFYLEQIISERVAPLGIVRAIRILRLVRIFKMRKMKPIFNKLYYRTCLKLGLQKQLPLINYALENIYEQFKSVIPISLYIIVFQFITLGTIVSKLHVVVGGLLAVIGGLFLFVEGLKYGLMPMGELIGKTLPAKFPQWVVLVISFLTGLLVTFAEPAVGALTTLGALVPKEKAPYLAYLLGEWDLLLLLFVGLGVGIAAVVGMLRFTYGWSLKPLIYMSLGPAIIVTAIINWAVPDLVTLIGLAWDCGAITTGPVTVPIVLALGLGVASTVKKPGQNSDASTESGFGIVTLASLYPIMAVELLGFILLGSKSKDELIALELSASTPSWDETTPGKEIVLSIRAIMPLIVFMLLVIKLLLKEKLPSQTVSDIIAQDTPNLQEFVNDEIESPQPTIQDFSDQLEMQEVEDSISQFKLEQQKSTSDPPTETSVQNKKNSYVIFFTGLAFAQIGMIIFNFGLTYGLSELGQQVGSRLPGSFTEIPAVSSSPRFSYGVGIAIVIIFAWFLGFLATQAEPALQVLGAKVEELGEMSSSMLVFAVSTGVGTGISVGMVKVIYEEINLIYFILGGYAVAILLTIFSSEFLVNVAWDSAGVTTGPVTVPFVLTLGVSLGSAVNATEGFGILTLASVGPIVSVLLSGVIFKIRMFIKWKFERYTSKDSSNDEKNSVEMNDAKRIK